MLEANNWVPKKSSSVAGKRAWKEAVLVFKTVFILNITEQALYAQTDRNSYNKYKCPSTHEWIKKMCYMYIMDYIAIKKNEIMPSAATWMDLKIIILSEVS